MKKGKGIALLPIGVFLVLYLGLGILFEYVMEIPMGFYNVPIVVAFLAAILVACLQNRALDFDKKLEIMAQGVGDKNIITMLLIFLAAGSFVGVVGRSSAESVAYCMLSLIPARFSVSVLFIVACFVSVAMGTSVGTITLLTPIAAAVSTASGFDLAFLRNGDFEIELFQCYEYKEMSEERKVPNLDLKTLGTKHICFAVDNLDALVETFYENDVEIVQGPEHLIGNYYCFIHGPNDILIEFIEH